MKKLTPIEIAQNSETDTGAALAPVSGSAAWIKVSDQSPTYGAVVETKIDDERGVRNVTALKRCDRLWFFPDMSMYVYYEPTHWRPLPTNDQSQRRHNEP